MEQIIIVVFLENATIEYSLESVCVSQEHEIGILCSI